MNLIQLRERLKSSEKHNDLPVFLLVGKYEYGITDVRYAKEGPLPHLAGIQTQVLPARIVLIGGSGALPLRPSDSSQSYRLFRSDR